MNRRCSTNFAPHEVRAAPDAITDKINGKVQRAEQMKVHTMFVIGKRDMAADAV
jgi:threonyl-tRNA synthetase